MTSIPLLIQIYLYFNEHMKDSPLRLRAVYKGFWLGVLSRQQLQLIDRIYYEQTSSYCDESYNKSGFFNWERIAFLKFFQPCQKILVAAIGGRREVIALDRIGFDADGFECNRQLFEFAEKLFIEERVEGEFHLVPNDAVWHFGKIYDGAIVGWAAYMLIQGRAQRIEFLKKLRVQLRDGAQLLVSFYAHFFDEHYFKRLLLAANIFRRLLFREPLEFGDDLLDTYVHWFTQAELASEFSAAGFRLDFFSDYEYGHAIGFAV